MDFNINIDFDISKPKRKSEFVKIKHKITKKMVYYKKAYDLVKEIAINKNETIYLLLNGDFVFGDFIGAFIQINSLNVKELTVVSLSGGVPVFEMLEALIIKKWVKKVNLLLSGYYLRTEQTKHSKSIDVLNTIKENQKDKFNIYYTNTHQKIILIETEEGGFVTMHGSANLKSSQSLEQLSITENKELYMFNYQYFMNLINKKK